MKKIILAGITLAMIFVLGSCTTHVAPIHVSLTKDTGYMVYMPVTRPRFSCSGKRLKNPALVGKDSVWKKIAVTADTTLYAKNHAAPAEIAQRDLGFSGNHGTSFWGPVFEDIFMGALALILIALAVWFLIWLIKKLVDLLNEPGRHHEVYALQETQPVRTQHAAAMAISAHAAPESQSGTHGAAPAPAQNQPSVTINRGANGEIDISIF